MANSFDRIYAVVKKIPRGTVASYGQVALLAGNPRWARVVGYALHVNPDPEGIPCYRVVTKDGRTSPALRSAARIFSAHCSKRTASSSPRMAAWIWRNTAGQD